MRAPSLAALLAIAVLASACRGVLKKEYEYEEELYLDLDGSATVYLNASVPALVALRGLRLDMDPRARLDRRELRRHFEGEGLSVSTPTLSRRHGRRFVHVRVDAERVADLRRAGPFSWSTYEIERDDQEVRFRQVVGAASGEPVGNVGWTGRELVAFRMHLPSRIMFHNVPSGGVQRGNILAWEQPLADRLRGAPLDLQARMDPESILYRTLVLFAATGLAALGTMALVIWWIARKGRREAAIAESPPSAVGRDGPGTDAGLRRR